MKKNGIRIIRKCIIWLCIAVLCISAAVMNMRMDARAMSAAFTFTNPGKQDAGSQSPVSYSLNATDIIACYVTFEVTNGTIVEGNPYLYDDECVESDYPASFVVRSDSEQPITITATGYCVSYYDLSRIDIHEQITIPIRSYVEIEAAQKGLTGWNYINGNWYFFDSHGNMETGWIYTGGFWYYMRKNGAMAHDCWIGNYYVTSSGAMATNTWIGDCFVGADGVWVPGATKQVSGQWIQSSGKWWYRHSDGTYTRNGWERIHNAWYHFDASGWMQTGWIQEGTTWYYLESSGVMAHDKWVGNYYLESSGAMAVNKRIGPYYVGADGAWVPSK